jgi:cobaltochelatase CobN
MALVERKPPTIAAASAIVGGALGARRRQVDAGGSWLPERR